MTLDKTVTHLNNAGGSNWNKKPVEAKDIISKNYKPLITLPSDSLDFSIIQDDVCITP